MVANITRTIEEMKEEAEHRGIEKGIQEGRLDIARELLDILDNETIAIKTGVPLAIVQELRQKSEI